MADLRMFPKIILCSRTMSYDLPYFGFAHAVHSEVTFFSSPEPKAHGELIIIPVEQACVRPSVH